MRSTQVIFGTVDRGRVGAIALGVGILPAWLAIASPATAQVDSANIGAVSSPAPSRNADVTLPLKSSPHLLQTLLASAVTLGAGTTWYFIDDRNVLDWDKPSLKSRLSGSSWRYDSNNFWMNFNGHPLFGAGVYATARASHLRVPYAFLASFLTSMTWEFVIEYNERVSINDVIVTPLAGFAVGEFAHKLGYYLSSFPRPNSSRNAVSWTLSPWTPLANLGCDDELRERHPTDHLGYASGLWHEFALSQAWSVYRTDGHEDLSVYAFRSSGKLAGLPDYRASGQRHGSFWNADVSRLSLLVEGSREGSGIDLVTDSILFGYSNQSLGPAGGHEELVGAALGYRYQDSFARGQDDRRSWVGFPGLATELYWERPGLSSEFQLRAYPVFGGVSSPAFQPYYKRHPDRTFKKVLSHEGYFYGWGLAGELQTKQRVGIANSEFTLRAESIWSDEGLDRAQEEVTDDTKASDISVVLEWSTWLTLPHSLAIGMTSSVQLREARAADVRMMLSQRSLGLWLGARF